MSYTKHTGTNSETITATKLNNIENGIEAGESSDSDLGFVVVTRDIDTGATLNLTGQEIYDASLNSIVALVNSGDFEEEGYNGHGGEINFMDSCYCINSNYCRVTFGHGEGSFSCDSPSEYPHS